MKRVSTRSAAVLAVAASLAACESSRLDASSTVATSCTVDDDCAFYLACVDGACRHRCSADLGERSCQQPETCRLASGAREGVCVPPVVEVPPPPPPPPLRIDQTYAGICVTSLTGRDPERPIFRLYTEASYVREADAVTGTLALVLTPMRSWDSTKQQPMVPPRFQRSETRGAVIRLPNIPVRETGRFTVSLGGMVLPPEANGLTGREARLEAIVLDGVFGAESFCATFAGNLVMPSVSELKANENTCLFFKRKEGEAFPLPEMRDLVCPLPP